MNFLNRLEESSQDPAISDVVPGYQILSESVRHMNETQGAEFVMHWRRSTMLAGLELMPDIGENDLFTAASFARAVSAYASDSPQDAALIMPDLQFISCDHFDAMHSLLMSQVCHFCTRPLIALTETLFRTCAAMRAI